METNSRGGKPVSLTKEQKQPTKILCLTGGHAFGSPSSLGTHSFCDSVVSAGREGQRSRYGEGPPGGAYQLSRDNFTSVETRVRPHGGAGRIPVEEVGGKGGE